MEKVIVLMSTYNGATHIREQLDSILSQEGIRVSLLVRDDGSTDSTPEILDDYSKRYPEIIDIIHGNNIGWRDSFFCLLREASERYPDGRFFALADQDDIWMPRKLSTAVATLEKCEDKIALYCSNLYIFKEGKNLGLMRGAEYVPTFKNCLIRNYCAGCTSVFTRPLLTALAENLPSTAIAHDYWIYMTAMLCGEVYIDPQSHILYRQHSGNQIGAKRSFGEIWQRRIAKLQKHEENHLKEHTAQELLRIHKSRMKPEAIKVVEKLARYRESLPRRISLLIDKGFTYSRPENDFWLRLRILLGIL